MAPWVVATTAALAALLAVKAADGSLPAGTFRVQMATWELTDGDPPEEEVIRTFAQPTDCELIRRTLQLRGVQTDGG